MASRQNYSSQQVLNSQTTANSTTNSKEKSSHNKSESKLLKHDKSSSSSSGHIPMSSNTIINNMSKRKGTSFQITSVSVNSNPQQRHNQQQQQQGQRNSTDNNNGDDSCDDLDDSHTDDNISRITDYETPSISETFSGEDVFFAQPDAFGTAPVIPTSSQYGLAIVGPDLVGGNGSNLTDVHVSVTDAGINIMGGPISSKQDVDHKNERFKVVKIESTEPFKRGRWMCMDYLDHTTLQDDGIDGKEGDDSIGAGAGGATKDESSENSTMTGSKLLLGINNGDIDHGIHSDNEELDHEVNRINSSSSSNNIDSIKLQQQDITTSHNLQHHNHPTPVHNQQQPTSHHHQHHHPQTMTSISNFNDHSNNIINNQVAQSMPQGQIEMILTQEKFVSHSHENAERNLASGGGGGGNSSGNSVSGAQIEQMSSNVSNINSSANSNTSQPQQQFPNTNVHAQTMTQEMIHSMMYNEQQQQQHQQAQQNFHQGVTLPTNILMQNIGASGAVVGDSLTFQQSQQPHQINSPNSSHVNALPQMTTNASHSIADSNAVAAAAASNVLIAVAGETTVEFNSSTSGNTSNQDSIMTSQTGDRIESDNHHQQQTGSLVTNENINISNNNSDNNNNITISNDGTQQNASSTSSSSQAGLAQAEGGANDNPENATVSGGAEDGQAIGEDNESASGTSAVAIDNKIEQAMDLVKSHLMFAVREEVEVLKEKIAELMDRINQLEVENTILKANASQETLSQLTTVAVAISPQTQTQPAATQQQQSASPVISQVPPPQQTQQTLPQQLISAPSQPQATLTQAAQASTQSQSTS